MYAWGAEGLRGVLGSWDLADRLRYMQMKSMKMTGLRAEIPVLNMLRALLCGNLLQVENLVMMAAIFRRTLVMPDHLAGPMDHQHALPTSFSDFFDFTDLSRWISIISMDEYLTHRWAAIPTSTPLQPTQIIQGACL